MGTGSVVDIFINTLKGDVVVIIVFSVLIFMSFVSWGIIFYKFFHIRSVKKADVAISEMIELKESVKSIRQKMRLLRKSPLFIFVELYSEFKGKGGRDIVESAEFISRKELSGGLSFLATVGNVAPFIGLFGTVWGIMKAFHMIGTYKSANLAVVAPGISEALVNTALGLFVAIPAVMFYNYYSAQVDSILDNYRAYALLFLEIHSED